MLPFKVQSFGQRERHWTEEEYEEKEKIIMHSRLANLQSRNHVGIGHEEKWRFQKFGLICGSLMGVGFFFMPWVRQKSLFVRLGIASANSYITYNLFNNYGDEIWKERVKRGWIVLISENDMHEKIFA